jgi:hypothetical protein
MRYIAKSYKTHKKDIKGLKVRDSLIGGRPVNISVPQKCGRAVLRISVQAVHS